MESEGKWIWEMTSTEKMFEPFITSYQVTIASREPIREEDLRRTLSHLYRKTPTLRTCYGIRNGERWIKEMDKEVIDFEVVPDASVDDLLQELINYEFKETGPLWCIRYKPGTPTARDSVPGFPHTGSIFLGIDHPITDGTSNVKICGFIIQLLNDVIAGKSIDDNEQLGVHLNHDELQGLIEKKVEALKVDEELKHKTLKEWSVIQEKTSSMKSFYHRVDDNPKTIIVAKDLDEATTDAFLKKCRAEGVTVNSAFTVLFNMVTVEYLMEKGLQQDTYNIRSDHVINARRYLGGDTSKHLGLHLLPLFPAMYETPRNVGDKFWDLAKVVQNDFHGKLKADAPFVEEAAKRLMGKDANYEMDLCITNLGNVTKFVTEGGDHVQPTDVLRIARLHTLSINSLSFLHTFRGRLTHAINCHSSYYTEEMADDYCDRIFRHLRAIL